MKNAFTMAAVVAVLGLSTLANPAAAVDLDTSIRIQGRQALAELRAEHIRELHAVASRLDMPGVSLGKTREVATIDRDTGEAICPVSHRETDRSVNTVTAQRYAPVATERVSG